MNLSDVSKPYEKSIRREMVWRGEKKTHASSPSTSGKSHEKTSVIQTRPTVVFIFSNRNASRKTRESPWTWSR